jgi:hypothetical protein
VHLDITEMPTQCGDAPGVIQVMMRDQNAGQAKPMRMQESDNRLGIAGVDSKGVTGLVMKHPDVVVAECGYRVYVEHEGHGAGSGPCMI